MCWSSHPSPPAFRLKGGGENENLFFFKNNSYYVVGFAIKLLYLHCLS
jgi:hypothetical protein